MIFGFANMFYIPITLGIIRITTLYIFITKQMEYRISFEVNFTRHDSYGNIGMKMGYQKKTLKLSPR